MTPEEWVYADATLNYLRGVVVAYPQCQDLRHPPEPKITRFEPGHSVEHCPERAIACYIPTKNHIYYEDKDMATFSHEYAHAILTHSKVPFECMQELVIQQMDYIFFNIHFKAKKEKE